MLPRVCRAAVLVLLSLAAFAQPTHLGDAIPLAGTRYGTARGHAPLLTSNGRDPVLFWTDGRTLRVSRFVNGRFVVSRALGEIDYFDGTYDVVWTGTQFLVVFSGSEGVFGRLLDGTGEPRGDLFLVAPEGHEPRLAFNGRNVLLLYVAHGFTTGLYSLLLTPDGRPAEAESRPLDIVPDGRVALASNGDSFAALVPNIFDPALLFFDAGGRLKSTSVFGAHGAGVAIATDGRRYLGVAACGQDRLCMPAVSRLIEADGTAGPAVELDQPFHANPSVVWNGTRWVVAYLRDLHLEEPTVQVVHLDSSARAIERREERPAVQMSLAVIGGGVLGAWIGDRHRDTIHVGPVPFDSATSVPAVFTATEQSLAAVASSARGTLVVWQERGNGAAALRLGFRALDGTWSEREIVSFQPPPFCLYCDVHLNAVAAGDGQQFMLYTFDPDGPRMRRLDGDGSPIGEPFSFPFAVDRMLWDGRNYVLFHSYNAVTRMTPDGTIVSTAQVPAAAGQAHVSAVSGDGGLIFVRIDRKYVDHYPRIVSLAVVRLDRDLVPIDTEPIRLAVDDQYLGSPGVGWDGRQYVVTWVGRDGIMAAHIPASGAAAVPREIRIADGRTNAFLIEPVPGAAAIQWKSIQSNHRWGPHVVAFLRHDGSSTAPVALSASHDHDTANGRIAPLANGDVAYVESSRQPAVPFENATHVMFRILSNAPLPPRPSALRLTSTETVLTWEAPPQPVDGYRLEARIDEGPWVEIAPPLPRDARSFSFPRTPGSRHTFRIRAWNESGLGPYSSSGRRRAVAHPASP